MIKKPQQSGHLLYVLKYRQIPPHTYSLAYLPTYLLPPEGGRKLRVLNNLIIPQILGKYLRPTKVKGRAFNGADQRAPTTNVHSFHKLFFLLAHLTVDFSYQRWTGVEFRVYDCLKWRACPPLPTRFPDRRAIHHLWLGLPLAYIKIGL